MKFQSKADKTKEVGSFLDSPILFYSSSNFPKLQGINKLK